MLIFLDEDRSYRSWLAHHGHGFVLDGLRRPTRQAPVLHRAACGEVKPTKGKPSRGTKGRHFKACALEREELLAWAEHECDKEPELCEACRPGEKTAPTGAAPPRRLTRLGKDIVDYVVDVAVISLDEGRHYSVTVTQVGQYLGKTPGQLAATLWRLIDDGYLRTDKELGPKQKLTARQQLFPTALAMRTLPFYQHMPVRKVKEEIELLREE